MNFIISDNLSDVIFPRYKSNNIAKILMYGKSNIIVFTKFDAIRKYTSIINITDSIYINDAFLSPFLILFNDKEFVSSISISIGYIGKDVLIPTVFFIKNIKYMISRLIIDIDIPVFAI